jgi:hypothetical protein
MSMTGFIICACTAEEQGTKGFDTIYFPDAFFV